jgi:acyl-CoA dehydrogenase
VVRSVLEGRAPYAEGVWQGLADMGLIGTGIPEQHGGVGLPAIWSSAWWRRSSARVLAPVPFGSTVYLAAEALLLWGSETQQSRWLPAIATGAVKGALAVVETREQTTPERIDTRFAGGSPDRQPS